MGDAPGLGRRGEDAAAQYLQGRGMTIVARNWRCTTGEIDIVAREGSVLVFCEVKTRRGLRYGPPLEAITPAKAARLRRLAGAWLAESGGHAGQIRIDAVGILWYRDGLLDVRHVLGAG